MKECFDYQASPRLDIVFNTYKRNNIIIYLFIIFFREN